MEEVLIARTAANLSYRNPVERVHSIANLGLQSVGLMRKRMSEASEKLMVNANSNEEIRKLCQANDSLRTELAESMKQPKKLLEQVFQNLSLKGKNFEIFDPATERQIADLHKVLTDKFDDNILSLSLRNNFTKTKYPKFFEFYSKHCISRTYHFHIFKCSDKDCKWHEPLRFGEIEKFGEPVPTESDDGVLKYVQGSDESEKFLPSKLENPSKRTHGMPFTPTAQTAINVAKCIKCCQCSKPRVIYAKKKFTDANKRSMKRILNDFHYVCGTVFSEIPVDERNKDSYVLEMMHCRENLSCESPIEIPYYSSKLFSNVCFHCGRASRLLPSNVEFYPQCMACQSKARAKVTKRKQVVCQNSSNFGFLPLFERRSTIISSPDSIAIFNL